MNDQLELLDAYLKGWNSENERYATEYESSEFLRGTMFAIDRIRVQVQYRIQNLKEVQNQIQNLKEDDN